MPHAELALPCRHYYSWVLAMLISQQNQLLHTFPRTVFSVSNFTVGGYSCMPDKIPIDRRISYPLASNLYKVGPPFLIFQHALYLPCPLVSRQAVPAGCVVLATDMHVLLWAFSAVDQVLPEVTRCRCLSCTQSRIPSNQSTSYQACSGASSMSMLCCAGF